MHQDILTIAADMSQGVDPVSDQSVDVWRPDWHHGT